MLLLELQSVAKHFGPEPVLDGVSFEVRSGERIGLIGPNGTGKTTLLKIIAGAEEADGGTISRHPSLRIGFLEQSPDFPAQQTVWDVAASGLADLIALAHEAEQVAEQLSRSGEGPEHDRLAKRYDHLQHELQRRDGYHVDHRIERVLDGLGFAASARRQPVGQLSGGQQNRLLLARLLLSEPDLMLLDEPSNHLDLETTQWLENFLAESSQALLLVSHDRYFLDKVTTKTLELFHGTADSYVGNFSAYWRQKVERVQVQRRTYEKQQEQIAKAQDFIRRNHHGQKSAQAEDRRKKLERIEPVPPPREIAAPPMRFPAAGRTGDIVLRVERAAKAYDQPLFSGLSFDILRGQRWGVLGPNGSGKTTLLRCVIGEAELDDGRIILGTGVKPGYLDQLTSGLEAEKQVVEAIRPVGKEYTEPQRRDMLARFGLTGDMVFQSVQSLSGGERNRAGLARLAAEEANFLILDEPTNHLDLWARDSLERAIKQFEGTVLLVSHDRFFLNRVVDRLLVVERDRFRVIDGNYDTYQLLLAASDEQVQEPKGATTASRQPTKPESGNTPTKRKRRFPYRKLQDIEEEIMERETAVGDLQLSLAEPEVYKDGERVKDIQADITLHEEALARLYEHWEEAAELN